MIVHNPSNTNANHAQTTNNKLLRLALFRNHELFVTSEMIIVATLAAPTVKDLKHVVSEYLGLGSSLNDQFDME